MFGIDNDDDDDDDDNDDDDGDDATTRQFTIRMRRKLLQSKWNLVLIHDLSIS